MRKWLLVGIILLAFFLRVPLISSLPIGFTPDEASFGYDAYSLIKTGKDQWGHFLPLYLESFGDFKPPLYSYLSIPSVLIFGLTKFATRLPNALIGVSAVYVTYLLVKELGKFLMKKSNEKTYDHLPLMAALLLAISPWHIMLSRGAYEANLSAFFMPLGIYLFLKGQSDKKSLAWSAFIFGLNIFSYHSARLVTPLMVLALIYLFREKNITKSLKKYSRFVAIFGLFVVLVLFTFTKGAGRRVSDVSIFRGALEAQADARLAAIESGMNPNVARIFHNKYLVTADRFIDSYSKYFSPKFLFQDGAGEGTYGMIPGIGVLYWFELPFLIGFLILLAKDRKSRFFWVILIWIILSPIPASLTTGRGYAGNRAAVIMPSLQIASSLGLYYYYQLIKKDLDKKALKLFSFGLSLVLFVFFLSFLQKYLNGQASISKSMLYGNLEAAYWLEENDEPWSKVIVSTRLSEPHIFIAFSGNWDPVNYQLHTKDWDRYKDEELTFLDQLHRYNLGDYVFQKIENKDFQNPKTTILAGRPEEFSDGLNVIKSFHYPNGKEAILIAEPYGDIYANSRVPE